MASPDVLLIDEDAQTPTPWTARVEHVQEWLSGRLDHDRLQFWLFTPKDVGVEGLVCSWGNPRGDGGDKLAKQFARSELMARAQRSGRAVGAEGREHAALHLHPETLMDDLWWGLLISRKGKAFSDEELDIAHTTLRFWQAAFNRPMERGIGRMIVSSDGRVVHVNPGCKLLMLEEDVDPATCFAGAQEIRTQRWGDEANDRTFDIVKEIGGRVVWVVMRWMPCAGVQDAGHWRVEIRELEENELPAVGILEDDRIARSVGFIHDHHHEAPSLAAIANHAHISPFHFHRLFTKQVGVSPKHYVQMKQLQVARWRLRAQRTPIGQIAEEAGFANHGHFTSTFRRVVGVSPTMYRTENAG